MASPPAPLEGEGGQSVGHFVCFTFIKFELTLIYKKLPSLYSILIR